MHHILFIHLWTDVWVASAFWLLGIQPYSYNCFVKTEASFFVGGGGVCGLKANSTWELL